MFRNERTESHIELVVRYGIVIDLELGAVSAWTFLASYGVSKAVIMRVLLDKDNRRQADKVAIEIAERYKKNAPGRETIHATFGVPSRLALR